MNIKEYKNQLKSELNEYKHTLEEKLNEYKEKLNLKLKKFKEKENKKTNKKQKKGGLKDIRPKSVISSTSKTADTPTSDIDTTTPISDIDCCNDIKDSFMRFLKNNNVNSLDEFLQLINIINKILADKGCTKITLSEYIRYLGKNDNNNEIKAFSSTDNNDDDNSPDAVRLLIQNLKTELEKGELEKGESESESESEELKVGLNLFLNQINEKIIYR